LLRCEQRKRTCTASGDVAHNLFPLFLVGAPSFRGRWAYFRALAGIIATRFLAASTAAHDIKIAATNELSGHNPPQSSGTL
ncbi:MAG: hypothetical protein ACREVW_08255, partial [Burkholderiales bacterium]